MRHYDCFVFINYIDIDSVHYVSKKCKNKPAIRIRHRFFTKIPFPPFPPPPPGPLPPKGEKTHPEPEYARMQNLAWIGPRVVQKSLTKNEQKNSKTNTSPFALTSEWRVKTSQLWQAVVSSSMDCLPKIIKISLCLTKLQLAKFWSFFWDTVYCKVYYETLRHNQC